MTPQRPPAYRDKPLPPNPYMPHSQPDWHNAYDAASKLEKTHEIHGRVLGYLMLEALDDDARDYVATGISTFEQEPNGTTLHDLAQIYIDHFLALFFHQEGGAPYDWPCDSYYCDWSDSPSGQIQPWDHPGPKKWELDLPTINPTPHTLMEAKHAALHRDGKRCVMSGHYDYELWAAGLLTQAEGDIMKSTLEGGQVTVPMTRPTHIFPPFTRSDEGEADERSVRRYTFQAIDIARGYGHIDVVNELKPSRGQRLSNIMSMGICSRTIFNHQYFWLEPVSGSPLESDNIYSIESPQYCGDTPCHSSPRLLTFTTTDDRLEVPDPRYLRLHAVACRIAHMSGAHLLNMQTC